MEVSEGETDSGKERRENAEITIEDLDVVNDPGYVPIQGEAAAAEAAAGDVAVNEENFPDWTFREYVRRFDRNRNGILEADEIRYVTEIEVEEKRIANLKGIEFFKSLVSLECGENQLSSLNVSGNPALIKLNCEQNQLGSLDVSGNPLLRELDCSWNQLGSLNVGGNSFLNELDCEKNQLSSLDVSSNLMLTELNCGWNQLSSLDVSGNLMLTELDCGWNQLSSLDVSGNRALTDLDCENNILQVPAPVQVDGIWQMNLAAYVGSGNLSRVTVITGGASLSGETVLFGSARPAELTYRYDTKAPSLYERDRQMTVTLRFLGGADTGCAVHDMVTVTDREATCGTPGIQHRECRNCSYKEAPTEIPATGVHSFGPYVVKEPTCGTPGIQYRECRNCGHRETSMEIPATGAHSFGPYVVTKEATETEEGIQTRTCVVCGETESISIPKKGAAVGDTAINEENFPDGSFREYVRRFDKDRNGLLEADETGAVTEIEVDHSGITSLKGIELFKSLVRLECGENQLSSLDVSGNPLLAELDCEQNQLSSLNVTSNPALIKLNCEQNQLSSLDVSGNPLLTELDCGWNQLSSLDVSGNRALTDLDCENNILQVPAPVQVDGIWQMNLAAYVGSGNLSRVTVITGGTSLSGETVLFGSARPAELTYRYDTKAPSLYERDRQMTVTLRFLGGTDTGCAVHDMVTVTDREATCGTPGIQHRECRNCTYKEAPTEIPATGVHSFGPYVVTKEATCGTPGIQYRKCEVCGTVEAPTEIPATGVHSFGSYVVTKEATCGTPGIQYRKCEVCGTVETPTEIPATGVHSFGPYVVTKEATVTEEGIQTRTCAVCGKTESASIPKLAPADEGSAAKISMQTGQTITKVQVESLLEGDDTVSLESGNKNIVKVTKSGKLKAQKRTGTAVVTVTLAGGQTRKLEVTVQKSKIKTTKLSGLPKAVVLKKGDELALNPVITPVTSQDKVTYKSSNKKIVTVSAKGNLKGRKAGKAKITVTSGKKKVTITVKVKK